MSDLSAFLSGAASGFTVRLITQPLDVLKIRFQLQIEPISKHHQQSYYKSMFHASRRIFAEEGIVGLWKGHLPAQCLSIVFGAVQFQTFEGFYSLTNVTRNSTSDLMFGGMAGLTASLFCHPLDVIRTRLSSQGKHKIYKGSINAIIRISVEDGLYGFFRGLVPSLILIFPQTAIQFFIYHSLSRHISSKASEFDLKAPDNWNHALISALSGDHVSKLFCGSIAGISAKFSVYPLDLAKRRLQVQGNFEEARLHFGRLHRSLRMLDSLRKTALEEGVLGLYKGLVPSSIKAGVVSSLTFYFYEQFRRIL